MKSKGEESLRQFYAHTKKDEQGNVLPESEWQLLEEHLNAVARKAAEFARFLGRGIWGKEKCKSVAGITICYSRHRLLKYMINTKFQSTSPVFCMVLYKKLLIFINDLTYTE